MKIKTRGTRQRQCGTRPHIRNSPKGLPFLLNFRDRRIRYYRQMRNIGVFCRLSLRGLVAALRPPPRGGNRTMTMLRFFAGLTAVVTFLSLAGVSHAQSGQEHMYQALPFIDPGYFQPDFQFFAPAEVSDYSGGEPPNTGIYVTFHRTYVNVRRPHDQFSFGSAN